MGGLMAFGLIFRAAKAARWAEHLVIAIYKPVIAAHVINRVFPAFLPVTLRGTALRKGFRIGWHNTEKDLSILWRSLNRLPLALQLVL